MGFQQGLSGLNAAAKNLDVIGNNVANANTVGFKQSQAQFADIYANAQGAGIGVSVAAIAQKFSAGSITSTGNPLDMAIGGSGQGFFQMDNNGATTYTRNGQFHMDKDGYVVNAQEHKLTGYPVNQLTGVITTGSAVPLQLPVAAIAPKATTKASLGLNLDSRLTPPSATVAFDPTKPATFNNSTAITIFDSLGNDHMATLYLQKDPVAVNKWNVYMTVGQNANAPGGAAPNNVLPPAANNTYLGQLTFDNFGAITGTSSFTSPITYNPLTGSSVPQNVIVDFGTTTQFGAAFAVNSLSQDGYTAGQLNSYSTSADGTIMGSYTNGKTQPLGQVLLVNFANPQGLKPLGNNEWSGTVAAGQPLVGVPGTSSLGTLQSGMVEDSNVDLTAELVNMITAQRVYQANAQTIKAQDTILQTITNLR